MEDKPSTQYLAISRRAFNNGVAAGLCHQPFNKSQVENDYFLLPLTDNKGWEAMPLLQELVNTVKHKKGLHIDNFISLRIPSVSHNPNFIIALNVELPELIACARTGHVIKVDSLNELIDTYQEFRKKKEQASSRPPRISDKIMMLDQLDETVATLRKSSRKPEVGFTSGAFDIVHAGHVRFLEAARERCDYLVVGIASDRTVKEQKGNERPYVPEGQRAQLMAGMAPSSAVIISDEPYHETILSRIRPEVLFKGEGYENQKIFGAELAGRVEIVTDPPRSNSTSAIVQEVIRRREQKGQGGLPDR